LKANVLGDFLWKSSRWRAASSRRLKAARLEDLGSPPGNKPHALTNDRRGEHAIRIDEKYRICFVWTAAGPENVEIVDYHGYPFVD
jgi:plasmid maintenance system killer protein